MIPKDLRSMVPCRDREVAQLLNLFGHDDPVPQCLFFSGPKSSGKSYALSKVLEFLNISHAKVDCVEGYLPRLLFESIICQLFGGDVSGMRCDDMMEFVNQLNRAAENEIFCSRTNVIILGRSERFRDMNPNLLPALLRLRELCFLKRVCVVLLSSIVWEKYIPPGGLIPPTQIFFNQYSQADIVEILSLDRPTECPADFYQRFLNLLVAVFFKYCCDVCELRYKANVIFTKYCEPIKTGKLQMDDSAALYQNIMPVLKSSIQTLYLRVDLQSKEAVKYSGSLAESCGKSQNLSTSAKLALSFELPYYAKYLLIAAYLASYNSSKEDKKLFVKHSDKTKKKMKNQVASKLETNSLMMGPKQFDLERLLAIFFSIVEQKPHVSVNLLSQVSTLVELRLLSKVGTDPLDSPKYKCVVGLEFIINISKTVRFTVTKYLICCK